MKKIIYFIIAAFVLAACSADRSSILKVYNWADYIDEELLDEFEEWYHEQTGEEVPLGEVLDFNEYMKSWRESAFSSSYVVSGDAAAMWAGDYQDVGGTFSEFYSISYLYS